MCGYVAGFYWDLAAVSLPAGPTELGMAEGHREELLSLSL